MDISKLKSMLSDAQAYWAATHNSYTTDLKFSYGIGQWDSKVESARRRAKRLVETYNIVQAFITPVVNAVREAPPGVDIKPIANADKMQARALSGLVRTIEQILVQGLSIAMHWIISAVVVLEHGVWLSVKTIMVKTR